MSLRPLFLPFLLGSLASSIPCQGRPLLFQGSRAFSGSVQAPARGYFSAPDKLTLEIRAGKARAGAAAAVLLGTMRASHPIPVGPDKFELDPRGLAAAWLLSLDSQGRGRIQIPVPAGIPFWRVLHFQGLVLTPKEPWTFRLTRALEAAALPGVKTFYVDGDTNAGKEAGTPFAPFRKISSALSAAAASGGGTVYVDGLQGGKNYREVLFIRSSGTTLAGRDWTGAGQGRPTVEGLMDMTPDKKRGTLNIRGTASSFLSGITVEGLRILPSGYKATYRGARCVRADYVKGLVFRDCRFEGVGAPGLQTVTGINLGWKVSALVEHCTVSKLSCSGKAPGPGNVHVMGIKIVQGAGEIVIRNTRIRDLCFLPVQGEGFRAVAGIWDAGSGKLVVANCVLGPMILPATGGSTGPDTDLYGIWTFSRGSIRNNVFHRFDLSAYKCNVKQVEGVRFYKGGRGMEFTNNIFADFRLGPVVGFHTCAAATVSSGTQQVSYSCVWKVSQGFRGNGFRFGPGILLNKDPLLVLPAYSLKQGSPCLGTGNPLYQPRNMGVWGGPWAGYPGCRW